jgi:Flp pilus assembly CpaE family ATPase
VSDVQSQGPTPQELKHRFDTLQRVAILFTLSDNILRALARQMQPSQVPKGGYVIKQGELGDALFVIEKGRCEVVVEESAGHEITIAFLGPGDFFGEMALISEETRTATVRTLEDSTLLILDRNTLYATLPPDSDAIVELTKLVDQRKETLPNLIAKAKMVAPAQAATVLAVYSPKGGAGRTTIAINLAAALARQFPGEVLLIDLALPYNHAALMANLVPTGCLALASQAPKESFEEALLGAILHHPGGMMLLPEVLKPEHADLINPQVIGSAMTVVGNAFRYIIFDLGVALNENVLTVLEHSQRIILLATPELSTLKDISDLMNIFTKVLQIVPARLLITMNNKISKPVVGRDDVERTLRQKIILEIGYDGAKADEAAVKGEILVLTDSKSAIARGAEALAGIVVGLKPEAHTLSGIRKLPFGIKV